MLLTEIAILKNKTTEMEKECKTNRNTLFFFPFINLSKVLIKLQQCNKYKSELIQLRKQVGLPTDDIPLDEG